MHNFLIWLIWKIQLFLTIFEKSLPYFALISFYHFGIYSHESVIFTNFHNDRMKILIFFVKTKKIVHMIYVRDAINMPLQVVIEQSEKYCKKGQPCFISLILLKCTRRWEIKDIDGVSPMTHNKKFGLYWRSSESLLIPTFTWDILHKKWNYKKS